MGTNRTPFAASPLQAHRAAGLVGATLAGRETGRNAIPAAGTDPFHGRTQGFG